MNRNNRSLPFIVVLVIGLAAGFTLAALTLGSGSAPKAADGTEADHAAMQKTLDGMTAALEDKTGDAFDREFLAQMIAHHEGAVAMARLALKSAGHSEIKTLAEKIVSAQNDEIEQMREWQSVWYAP